MEVLRVFCRQAMFVFILAFSFQTVVFGQEKINWEVPFIKCWDFPLRFDNNGSVASDNNNSIIFDENNASIVSINASDGLENWRSNLGGKLGLNILLYKNFIYTFSNIFVDNLITTVSIRSIESKTGITTWQNEIKTNVKLKVLQNEEQLFIIVNSRTIKAINKLDGKISWEKNLTGIITSATFFGINQLLVFTDKNIYVLSLISGDIVEFSINIQNVEHSLFLYEKEFISGNSLGDVFRFDLKTKKNLWNVKIGGGVSSLVKTIDGVLVSSLDNFIYFFSLKDGKLKWRKRVAGRIFIEPLIIRNYVIVLNSNNNIALIIDIKNGKTVNQINIVDNDNFSSYPVITEKFLIFRTFKGISAFSNKPCETKKAAN